VSACLSSPMAPLAARGGLVHNSAQSRVEDLVAPDLLVALAAVADPGHARGVRHRLVTVLAARCSTEPMAVSDRAVGAWPASFGAGSNRGRSSRAE
jgi:hypothetical protein